MRNFTCFRSLTNRMSLSTENVSRMTREFLENGSMKSRKLFATIFILMLLGVGNAWGTDIVIDLDLTKSATYPGTFPTSSGTKSGTYTFGGYSFGFSCNTAVYRGSSGSGSSIKYYILIGKAGATESNASIITFPAIANYKLTEVVLTVSTTSGTNVKAYIGSGYSTKLTGGGDWTFNNSTTDNANVHTWSLSSTEANTAYKMYIVRASGDNTYNGQLAGLKLTYEPTASSYTVTYNGNGNTSGSVPTDATSYSSGATVTVKGNTGSLAKTGWTFAGWNTNATGTGTNYTAGSGTFSISANTTLYAKWTCTVTWSVNGLTNVYSAQTLTYNATSTKITSVPSPPSPASYCGDKFVGWTDDEDYVHGTSSLFTDVSGSPELKTVGDVTFYAVFADYDE